MITLIRSMQAAVVFGGLLMIFALLYSYIPKAKRPSWMTPDGIMFLGGIITTVCLGVGLYAVETL